MSRRLSVAALTAALALAGCGGNDDKSANTGTETAGTQPAAAPPAAKKASCRAASSPGASAIKVSPTKDLARKPRIPHQSGDAPGTLVAQDIVVGKGAPAEAGDTVTVQYVGVRFRDGQQFDASWNRHQPFTFPLGAGQVIQGWDKGVAGMCVGGRRQLTIPPDLAYGAQGAPPDIAPNETLVFVVDLEKVQKG
ncbi:MAG TPA: FKBP-type peptidyl-prolyl cis-trans isomerase [Solirubrobacteraceae bacterium]|jgi:peptidylprolyl isomerase